MKSSVYRLDMGVEGANDARLAVECDCDAFHGPDGWAGDMSRQRILERWTFWRCFASARFVVEREGQVRYDKVLRADGRWRTSLVGAIAIPAASSGASAAFQNLLSQFFNDRDFVKTGSHGERRP